MCILMRLRFNMLSEEKKKKSKSILGFIWNLFLFSTSIFVIFFVVVSNAYLFIFWLYFFFIFNFLGEITNLMLFNFIAYTVLLFLNFWFWVRISHFFRGQIKFFSGLFESKLEALDLWLKTKIKTRNKE